MKPWMMSLCRFAADHRSTLAARFPVLLCLSLPAVTPVLLRQGGGEALPGVRMGNHRQRALLPL